VWLAAHSYDDTKHQMKDASITSVVLHEVDGNISRHEIRHALFTSAQPFGHQSLLRFLRGFDVSNFRPTADLYPTYVELYLRLNLFQRMAVVYTAVVYLCNCIDISTENSVPVSKSECKRRKVLYLRSQLKMKNDLVIELRYV